MAAVARLPPAAVIEDLDHAMRLYTGGQLAGLPTESIAASAGCGNPTALAGLKSGERVLDLGSGGGIDCFLAAREVGETGHVTGLDMTPSMLELARKKSGRTRSDQRGVRSGGDGGDAAA